MDVPSKHLKLLTKARGLPSLLLVKPNQTELEEWAGQRLSNEVQILRAARGLLHTSTQRGLSSIVCVSLADKGAMLLAGDRAWMGIAPHIRARGTVGAGDSLVGGLVSRLCRSGITVPEDVARIDRMENHRVLVEALAWGMAAGAATAEAAGTSLAKASEIRRLFSRIKVRELV